jgi:hypothetical protein
VDNISGIHEDMVGKAEFFTSFLSATLVNHRLWGGDELFEEFQTKLRFFLDSKSDEWTQSALRQAFEEKNMEVDESRKFFSPGNSENSLLKNSENSLDEPLNRQLIALYCWMGILQKAIQASIASAKLSENMFCEKFVSQALGLLGFEPPNFFGY